MNKSEFFDYSYQGNCYYGISKSEIERMKESNRVSVMELDIVSAKKIYRSGLIANYIGILPPSIDDLRERLDKMGLEKTANINLALKEAKKVIDEISQARFLNFRITNDDLDTAKTDFANAFISIFPSLDEDFSQCLDEMKELNRVES